LLDRDGAREISQPRLVVLSANPKCFKELGPVLNIAETHVLEFGRLKRTKTAQAAQEPEFSPRPGAAVTSTFQSLIFFPVFLYLGYWKRVIAG
jgi:hypothetical protein